MKNQIQFFVPLILGLYSLVQGCGLAMSANPLIQLLGLGLWLWLPGCAYYTWRGYQALTSAVTEEPPVVEEQFESEQEGVMI